MRYCLLLWAYSLAAQGVAKPADSSMPENWYGAGAQFSFSVPSGTSRTSGWAAYGHLLSQNAKVYQFDTYSVYFVKGTDGKVQPVTCTAAGFLILIRQFGPVSMFAFGAAGVTTASTVGSGFPYGGLIDVSLKKTLWHIDVGLQQIPSSAANVPTQKSVLLGFGRTF